MYDIEMIRPTAVLTVFSCKNMQVQQYNPFLTSGHSPEGVSALITGSVTVASRACNEEGFAYSVGESVWNARHNKTNQDRTKQAGLNWFCLLHLLEKTQGYVAL